MFLFDRLDRRTNISAICRVTSQNGSRYILLINQCTLVNNMFAKEIQILDPIGRVKFWIYGVIKLGPSIEREDFFFEEKEAGEFFENNSEIIISGAYQKYSNIPESCLRFSPRWRGEIRARCISSTLDENLNNSGILFYFWFAPEKTIVAIRGRRDFFRDKKWANTFFTTKFVENSGFQKKL